MAGIYCGTAIGSDLAFNGDGSAGIIEEKGRILVFFFLQNNLANWSKMGCEGIERRKIGKEGESRLTLPSVMLIAPIPVAMMKEKMMAFPLFGHRFMVGRQGWPSPF